MRPRRPPRPREAPRALLAAALLLLPGALAAADLTPQQQIESRLMCYCGCADLTVRVCTCGTADGMRQEIAERLARGEGAGQVVAAFVARHGEKILSAPTKEGFNLLAWATPFAVLLAAGAALVLVVRRWSAQGAGAGGPASGGPVAAGAPPLPSARESELRKRIEREIREER